MVSMRSVAKGHQHVVRHHRDNPSVTVAEVELLTLAVV
jgi:hypothetical protein